MPSRTLEGRKRSPGEVEIRAVLMGRNRRAVGGVSSTWNVVRWLRTRFLPEMTTRRTSASGFVTLLGLTTATFCAAVSGSAWAGDAANAPGGPARSVTFNKDIAPLVFEHCASCHRPGEVAPFSLLGYRDVSKRAELVRTVTSERAMPPWKADSQSAHFADERRLSDAQIDLIAQWVKAGAPEGEPGDLPPTPKFTEGWQRGEPDLVVTMAEPYTLVAQGADEYRCFVLPVEVPSGKYIKAIEYRPGNRRIVHHAVLATLPQRAAQAKLDEGDGKSFRSGLAPPGQLLPGRLAFWTPGMVSKPLPDGFAAHWSNDNSLILQLHLHPSGKPETEQSSIGFYFTDEKPRGRLRLIVMSNNKIDIPPGEADFEVTKSLTLPNEVDLYGVFPHMHLLGRTMRVTATLPDGTTQPLISIGDWNFNWQHYYQYASPLHLPAGTRLDGRWTYDNSEGNPANPSQPPKRVTYGEQTVNEMAIMTLDVIPTGTGGKSPAAELMSKPENLARLAESVMRRADKNGDGTVDVDEAVALAGGSETREEIQRRVTRFDRDRDERLDLKELTEAVKALAKERAQQ